MFSNSYENYFRQTNAPISYVRALNASPNTPAVDIYLNDTKLVENLSYQEFTEYLSVTPGNYTVKIYPAGSTENLIFSENVTIPPTTISTTSIVGINPDISLVTAAEPKGPMIPGKLFLRFANLSPNSPNMNLTLANGTVLFRNVPFKGVTDYASLNPGIYHFQLRDASTNRVLLDAPNIRLRGNRFYSIYSVGILGGNPPQRILVPLDGNSYLNF
ncbi:hypothetical protein CPAST_c14990 [Clostridium pasteurianum DSM 525 = ATCC 6013]|uniref:DUF4397 domain-containing protein n=1 Tax=Clostridium pasteurianum DSM 525 = ATCC 6013 TaxID=1262449 RepID=A0A0H3J2C1_CLOPA|nr:DUF4397 domain-containing protein [Clostridium pasteurianum]AJA47574.1 hypothetical protein CPAST_c14990 [Clostridium pasteurianum DSM 525 = ATCC 6013]AJA51562.1 hypothetical protein CLPA_c14990 [Clostridium pasteurianum DSM 525 = ATCC 6013]AOZ74889.1 hypothetical protein AQ983_07245 [Clostridium pasteurianum DSM 525 = ATCC 6013]AOZ78684.1 hypothetical protein AQ984_07235 [Clostridium pasteurianum]ELP58085.1 hypothetical protein F502_16600 [Clostridium pasteurianum DSM 525 = ATCC 6013]